MNPSSLNDNIVYLCTEFSHHFSQGLRHELQANHLKITPEQLAILVFLFYHKSVSQKKLSDGLKRDKTTIARVIMNLEKLGLIKQTTHPDDARSKLVGLTKNGQVVQEKALIVSGSLYTKTVHGLQAKELAELARILHKLLDNLHSPS